MILLLCWMVQIRPGSITSDPKERELQTLRNWMLF